MDVARITAIWRGEAVDAYGHAAITGTLAIALKLLGRAATMEAAEDLAEDMWESRDRARLPAVA